MEPIKEEQVKKLLEDISEMKSVINKNRPLIQKMFSPFNFKIVAWAWGLGILILSLGIHCLITIHGSFSQIPDTIKIFLYLSMGIFSICIIIMKQRILVHTLQKDDPKVTIFHVFKEFFSFHIRHMYFPLLILMIFLNCIFIYHRQYYYIVPAISIFSGLLFNFLGSITKIRQYLAAGYWYIISAVFLIFFNSIPPLLGVALSIGLGSIIFAVSLKEN